jgi:hypothetical protein
MTGGCVEVIATPPAIAPTFAGKTASALLLLLLLLLLLGEQVFHLLLAPREAMM